MKRFSASLYEAAGILLLAVVLNAVGPKRVMAALGYTPVRDVDNPARQPVQFVLTLTSNYTVPVGKRLVIEHVSADFGVPSGGGVKDFAISTTVGGVEVAHEMRRTVGSVFSNGDERVVVCEPVRIYADPGTTVGASSITAGGVFGTIGISGYLVNLP